MSAFKVVTAAGLRHITSKFDRIDARHKNSDRGRCIPVSCYARAPISRLEPLNVRFAPEAAVRRSDVMELACKLTDKVSTRSYSVRERFTVSARTAWT